MVVVVAVVMNVGRDRAGLVADGGQSPAAVSPTHPRRGAFLSRAFFEDGQDDVRMEARGGL